MTVSISAIEYTNSSMVMSIVNDGLENNISSWFLFYQKCDAIVVGTSALS